MPSRNRSALSRRLAASAFCVSWFSAFSHFPVVAADVISWGATAISFRPFSVETIALPARYANPTARSRSIVAARVAGVPSPESFIRSRSSSSSSSRPACSIRDKSVASFKGSGGFVFFF